MKLRSHAGERPTCVFCRDRLEEDAATTRSCPGCGACYHYDCLVGELEGRCATLGCTKVLLPQTHPGSSTCRGCGAQAGHFVRVRCPGCQAAYHRTCLLETLDGRCATPGCTKVWRPRPNPGLRGVLSLFALFIVAVGITTHRPWLAIPAVVVGVAATLTHLRDRPQRGR